MSRARADARRRAIGIADLVVVLFGVLLGPLLHAVQHEHDHVHGPGSAVHYGLLPTAVSHEDAHARGLAHSHGDPAKPQDAHPGSPGEAHEHPAEHGRGSLEHFGVALLAPAVLVVPPSESSLLVPAAVRSVEEPVLAARHARAQPRGPPV